MMDKKIIAIILLLGIIVLFGPPVALGQQGSSSGAYAFITWQANNYYPADFSGKAMATNGTSIGIAINLVENQKIQDLSQMVITWYSDGGFLSQGTGLNQINFTVTKTSGDSQSIRADIQTSSGVISSSVSIPIVSPEVVVVNPYANQAISKSSQVNLEAMPYFFNVKSFGDLIFSWTVGDKAQTGGNDNELSLTMDPTSQGTISVAGRADNRNNEFESATGKTDLTLSQ